MQTPKPTNIIVDLVSQLFQIVWNTGHTSVYDLTYLRRACPCAECRPSRTGEPPESTRNAVGELKSVSDVSEVGGYAIAFAWADGHRYGIYNWEYLLRICPCEEHARKL